MKWNNIKITIMKELRGIIRDKKSMQKLIIYPLLIPMVIFLFGFLFDGMLETKYIVGINYELSEEERTIIDDLDAFKTEQYKDKKELETAYNNKEINGYIIKINDTYTLYADESQNSGSIILSAGKAYLESYNRLLGNNYLLKKGINPDQVYNSITIKEESLTKKDVDSLSSMLFMLIITYLIMIVIMVCVVVVTDATSGEKERGTLETILTFPIKSSELVMGKYLATAILGFIIGVIAYLLSIPAFTFGKEMFKSYEDIVFVTSFTSIILVIFVTFLAALLSAGVCMALAGKAKTYKEAQSSLQFVALLPMIPYFLNVMEIDSTIFNFIPIANCGYLLNDIVVNNIDYKSLFIIILTTILYTIIILVVISKQYRKEETLFS